MSLLHPTEDDYAFASAHADAGHRMALNRAARLAALLERAHEVIKRGATDAERRVLLEEIEEVLAHNQYAEDDDGVWRLTPPFPPPPPLKKQLT